MPCTDPDENVVQRRLGDFEALDLDPVARGQRLEDILRAGALRQRQAPVAVDLPRFQHAGHIQEVALPRDGHGIARKVALDLIDLAVQHRAPLVDQRDAAAQRFHLMHLVRGHDDGLARRLLFADDVFDQPRVDRIEPGERFVDHDQIRLVQQRGDDLRFLLHALAEFLNLLVAVIVQIEPLQPVGQAALRLGFTQAFKRARKINVGSSFKSLYRPRSSGK